MSGWVLGIDFGTCFTCAAISRDGRVDVIQGPDGGRLESAVSVDEDGTLVAGHSAANLAVVFPERAVRLPKRALADGPVTLVAGREVETAAIAGAVLRAAATEALRQAGGRPPDRVVLTCPALWGPGERQRLAEAGERAGLGSAASLAAELLTEPVAAARFYAAGPDVGPAEALPPGGKVAVFDFGGGTLDTAVLERTTDGFTVVGTPGGNPRLGGEDLDEALRALVERRAAESGGGPAWAELWAGASMAARRLRRRLLADITEAKTILADGQPAYVNVPGHDEPVRVTPAEFDEAVRPLVEQAVTELLRTIDAAGVDVPDLAGIYLTGGSSRVRLVGRLISQRLDRMPEERDDPKTVVVKGALTALPAALPHPAIPAPPEIQRAERIAREITIDRVRARALSMVAASLARTDPHWAAVVADESAKLAGPVTHDVTRAALLLDLITATSQAAPDRAARWTAEAEQVIGAMGGDSYFEREYVTALAKADPAAADRIARTLEGNARDDLLRDVALAATRDHPEEAERIALSIEDDSRMVRALTRVAIKISVTDPDHAERIARSIADRYREKYGVSAERLLVDVAGALVDSDPGRAEWITRSLAGWRQEKAILLERLAAGARGDRQRAARLGNLAVDLAREIYSPGKRAETFIQMAGVAATYDVSRVGYLADLAEESAAAILAQRTTHVAGDQEYYLSELAQAIAGIDPQRAARIADNADAAANSITEVNERLDATAHVARALAVTDPWRAVLIAEELCANERRDRLDDIAKAVALTAPSAAERIASMMAEPDNLSWGMPDSGLADVAKVVAVRDPVRAERIAGMIESEYTRNEALLDVARTLADSDLDGAERIAQAIPFPNVSPDRRLWEIWFLVQAAAKTDPDRAERIVRTAEVGDVAEQERLLTGLVGVLARTDPDRAERVAGTIADPEQRQQALWVLVQQLTDSTGFF